MSVILVTGARGNIGARVVSQLVNAQVRVRALVRRPQDAKFDASVEVVPGTYEDPASLRRAMEGVSRALLITSGPELARQDGELAAAARTAGVQQVVKLSVLGAPGDASEIPTWHRQGEARIEHAGLGWTFLRAGPFASNALQWRPTLRAMGKAFGAFGTAALPFLHPDDLAAVAALALTAPGHAGRSYELTGPAALTASQQVAVLGEVAGKHFDYVNVDDGTALRGMVDGGMPPAMAEAMLHLVQALRGAQPAPNDVVQRLLGRPARTFRQWAQENAAAFQ